jgi:hypothetical protein
MHTEFVHDPIPCIVSACTESEKTNAIPERSAFAKVGSIRCWLDANSKGCRFSIDTEYGSAPAVSDRMEPSLQHIPDSAEPRLDFIDFMASQTVVSLDFVAELAKIPEFSAGVAAHRSLLPLGYCGFFCWPAVHHLFRQLAEEPLLDYLRVAAYCCDLPAADGRHIDLGTASAKQRFPALFHIADFPAGPMRASYASALMARMGSFAVRHEFRAAGFAEVKKHDEDEYIAYLDQPA